VNSETIHSFERQRLLNYLRKGMIRMQPLGVVEQNTTSRSDELQTAPPTFWLDNVLLTAVSGGDLGKVS
jgi:hypothetical protein